MNPSPSGRRGGRPRVEVSDLPPDGPTPYRGPIRVEAGVELREVTFALRGAPATSQVMVVIRTLVDRLQDDVTSALCDRVGDVHALTWLLPDDGAWTYGFLVRDVIPFDIGHTQDAWRTVYADAVADPRARETTAAPDGSEGLSVYRGVDWCGHPDWTRARGASDVRPSRDDADSAGRTGWTDLEVPAYRARLRLACQDHADDGPVSLLVLFDGDAWAALGIGDALDGRTRRGRQPLHLLLLEAVEEDGRDRDLPYPDRIGTVVEQALAAAAAHLPRPPTAATTVVAGQSYGGLAAAGLLLHRPDLASSAVIQSGSFWFTPGVPQRRGGDEVGRLLHELQSQPQATVDAHGRRAVVQVGSDEGGMVTGSRAFTSAARRAGIQVAHREYRGGHDYAWWTHALSDGLDLLEDDASAV